MSPDESKQNPENAPRPEPGPGAQPPQQGPGEEHHAMSAQAQRDQEIEAIQQHSKHQAPGIQKPPELPPAPPGKALMIVAVLVLVLLIAGGLTLWTHSS